MRVVPLLGVLAGLLTMHGLAQHGMSADARMAPSLQSHVSPARHAEASMAAAGRDGGAVAGTGLALVRTSVDLTRGFNDGSPHGSDDVLGTCLAVLVSLLLLGLTGSFPPASTSSLRRARAPVVRFGRRSRIPAQPSLSMLSIRRC